MDLWNPASAPAKIKVRVRKVVNGVVSVVGGWIETKTSSASHDFRLPKLMGVESSEVPGRASWRESEERNMADEKKPVVVSSGWAIPIGTACVIAMALFGGYKWIDSARACLERTNDSQDAEIRDLRREMWTARDQQWYTRTLKNKLRSVGKSDLAETVPEVDVRLEERTR